MTNSVNENGCMINSPSHARYSCENALDMILGCTSTTLALNRLQ